MFGLAVGTANHEEEIPNKRGASLACVYERKRSKAGPAFGPEIEELADKFH